MSSLSSTATIGTDPSDPDKINIALYHGAISNCQTDAGWTMEHGEDNLSIFEEFDFAMLGDIHKRQFLDKEQRVYYAGSTIQQNHGEEDDKGFSVWTINSKDDWDIEHFTLQNPRPFITVELTRTGKIPRKAVVPANARLRLVSDNNLPLDVMRKAVDVAKHKFKPESISFLNRAAGKRGDVEELTDGLGMQNLRDPEVQQELISEYLKDYQVKPDTLSTIYELNSKYNQQVDQKKTFLETSTGRLPSSSGPICSTMARTTRLTFRTSTASQASLARTSQASLPSLTPFYSRCSTPRQRTSARTSTL